MTEILRYFGIVIEFDCKILIVFSNLLAEITAAAMDNKIFCTVSGFVNFNEMITSAQRSQTGIESGQILNICVAPQFFEIKIFYRASMKVSSLRQSVRCGIESPKINISIPKINGIHTAANIDSDDIWNNFVGYGHGGAYCTSFSCMNIRHYPDFGPIGEYVIAHSSYLFH